MAFLTSFLVASAHIIFSTKYSTTSPPKWNPFRSDT